MPIPMSAIQIADDLAERIKRGEYPPGTRMPTYRDLMELYDISYTTVAAVIVRLKERGMVVGVHGKGVYVAEE